MRETTAALLFASVFTGGPWFAATACSPAERQRAADVVTAVGPALCALAPLLDGPEVIGVLCQDAARLASSILSATVHVQEKGAPTPPCVLVPLQRVGGDARERVCERERERVLRALAKGAR